MFIHLSPGFRLVHEPVQEVGSLSILIAYIVALGEDDQLKVAVGLFPEEQETLRLDMGGGARQGVGVGVGGGRFGGRGVGVGAGQVTLFTFPHWPKSLLLFPSLSFACLTERVKVQPCLPEQLML